MQQKRVRFAQEVGAIKLCTCRNKLKTKNICHKRAKKTSIKFAASWEKMKKTAASKNNAA
jgi:hypothetical protein